MNIAVVGTGSWGTTLGVHLAAKGLVVRLWARTSEEAERLASERRNAERLPDHPFPGGLQVTSSLGHALEEADMVIIAVPSPSLRQNARQLGPLLPAEAVVVSATKGLERDTGRRMSEVLRDELTGPARDRVCVLSGPNLSREIADGMPASTVVASEDDAVAAKVRDVIMTPRLRAYTNSDVTGVELGGALKNVIAIGAGMSDGLGYGDNAKAAFINRGLVEITRLGVAAGARALTFAGLACLGDLIATCSSRLSRNYFVGEQLSKGRPLKVILREMRYVAEGVDSTVAALSMAGRLGVEMPIAEYTHKVLFEGMEPERAVMALMSRDPKSEWLGIPFS